VLFFSFQTMVITAISEVLSAAAILPAERPALFTEDLAPPASCPAQSLCTLCSGAAGGGKYGHGEMGLFFLSSLPPSSKIETP